MFTFLLAMLVASPVKVTGGMVAGVPGADSSIIAFKAIPFAAPPVGSLRWGAIAEAGSPEKLSFFERSLMAPPPPQRQVAVTIDDLPVGQAGRSGCRSEASSAMTDRLLKPVREEHIPVTAFVIANNCATLTVDERRDLLKKWIDAGAELGNHTWSHPDLNTMPIAEYEQDILRGDAWLRSAMDLPKVRFVRSPMLHTGPDEAAKRRLERFLAEHDWRQAVVTLDNSDWMFAFGLNDALLRKDDALAAPFLADYQPSLEVVVGRVEKATVEVVWT